MLKQHLSAVLEFASHFTQQIFLTASLTFKIWGENAQNKVKDCELRGWRMISQSPESRLRILNFRTFMLQIWVQRGNWEGVFFHIQVM